MILAGGDREGSDVGPGCPRQAAVRQHGETTGDRRPEGRPSGCVLVMLRRRTVAAAVGGAAAGLGIQAAAVLPVVGVGNGVDEAGARERRRQRRYQQQRDRRSRCPAHVVATSDRPRPRHSRRAIITQNGVRCEAAAASPRSKQALCPVRGRAGEFVDQTRDRSEIVVRVHSGRRVADSSQETRPEPTIRVHRHGRPRLARRQVIECKGLALAGARGKVRLPRCLGEMRRRDSARQRHV